MTLRLPLAVALTSLLTAGCSQQALTEPGFQVVQDPDPAPGVHQLRVEDVDAADRLDAMLAITRRTEEICGPDRNITPTQLPDIEGATLPLVSRFSCAKVFPDDVVAISPGAGFPTERFPLAPGLSRYSAWGSGFAPNMPKEIYRSLVGAGLLRLMEECGQPVTVARTLVGIDPGPKTDEAGWSKVHVVVDYSCDNRGSATASL
jgi:hypothetical protein